MKCPICSKDIYIDDEYCQRCGFGLGDEEEAEFIKKWKTRRTHSIFGDNPREEMRRDALYLFKKRLDRIMENEDYEYSLFYLHELNYEEYHIEEDLNIVRNYFFEKYCENMEKGNEFEAYKNFSMFYTALPYDEIFLSKIAEYENIEIDSFLKRYADFLYDYYFEKYKENLEEGNKHDAYRNFKDYCRSFPNQDMDLSKFIEYENCETLEEFLEKIEDYQHLLGLGALFHK